MSRNGGQVQAGLRAKVCGLRSGAGRPETLGDAGGHEASGSPAEKVSWTCSWITSRATKSCFSLKRPLYSRRPSRSLVANLYRGLSVGARNGAPTCVLAPHPSKQHQSWHFGQGYGVRMQMMSPNRNPGMLAPHPPGLGKGARQLLRVRTPQVLCQQLLLVLSLPHLLPHPLPGGAPHAHSALAPRGPAHSREGQAEVEALAQATEGDEGAGGEAACGHVAEGFLKVPGRAVTFETSHQQVDTGTPVLADAWSAAA